MSSEEARELVLQLVDDFLNGRMASIGFMRSMREIKQKCPEAFEPDPELGAAVVMGFGRHVSGRDLMGALLEYEGFVVRLVDIGVDNRKVVEMCQEPDVRALFISVQTLETVERMKDLMRELKDTPARKRIVVNIGGVAISPYIAKSVGADVYASTAVESVRLVA